MLIHLCLHVNLLRDDAICEGNPCVRVRERQFLVANRSGPLHVDRVHVLRVPALWLFEGHRLNALDAKGKVVTPVNEMTWPLLPVTRSIPGQELSLGLLGDVTHADEVSRKTVKMS